MEVIDQKSQVMFHLGNLLYYSAALALRGWGLGPIFSAPNFKAPNPPSVTFQRPEVSMYTKSVVVLTSGEAGDSDERLGLSRLEKCTVSLGRSKYFWIFTDVIVLVIACGVSTERISKLEQRIQYSVHAWSYDCYLFGKFLTTAMMNTTSLVDRFGTRAVLH